MNCLPHHYDDSVGESLRKLIVPRIGRRWTLFLDRDGVINRRIVGDYVRGPEQFEWLPNAAQAVKELVKWAPYLVVVTNQQGVGKGLMRSEDVCLIHRRIQDELKAIGGGAIDGFNVCPHLESAGCICRKPRPGLVTQWLHRHPESDPRLSLMVGDSPSDHELASNVAAVTGGCGSIHIGNTANRATNASFPSLWEFACAVKRVKEMDTA